MNSPRQGHMRWLLDQVLLKCLLHHSSHLRHKIKDAREDLLLAFLEVLEAVLVLLLLPFLFLRRMLHQQLLIVGHIPEVA